MHTLERTAPTDILIVGEVLTPRRVVPHEAADQSWHVRSYLAKPYDEYTTEAAGAIDRATLEAASGADLRNRLAER